MYARVAFFGGLVVLGSLPLSTGSLLQLPIDRVPPPFDPSLLSLAMAVDPHGSWLRLGSASDGAGNLACCLLLLRSTYC